MFSTEIQYIVMRYMINELADEAANVGIVAVSEDPQKVLFRFLDDPTVKSRGDAKVKRDVVDRFRSAVESRLQSFVPGTEGTSPVKLLGEIQQLGGNLMRTTMPRSVLTNDMEQEFNTLYSQWVSPSAAVKAVRETTTRDPLGGLKKEATRAVLQAFREGYGPLRKNVVLKRHEIAGKMHRSVFDLAIRIGAKKAHKEHVYQHLLVLPDAEESFTQAAGLAWKWDDIREKNGADRKLTAVLYGRRHQKPGDDTAKLLKSEEIGIAHVADLPELARKYHGQTQMFEK
jgi:hypothetical protein